jgi:type VI secretion system secreted protein VgrG
MFLARFFSPNASVSRSMTEGEIELACSIYKDQIDYSKVRIHNGGLLLRLLRRREGALSPGNNIF